MMAAIKRVAIVPPFFATDTLSHADEIHKHNPKHDQHAQPASGNSDADARLTDYAAQLRKLMDHAAARLPARVAARTPFTVIPAAEVDAALKALEWTPEKLFQYGGRLRGTNYPPPDAEAVRKLAAQLHADALLLTVMDEPRRNGAHYFYTPLSGLDYRSAQVESRAGFFVLTADVKEAMRDDVDVVHPLTHIGNREYLLTDWMETQDVMFEDLLDEWSRYTPEK
jgi:hypothetical protein